MKKTATKILVIFLLLFLTISIVFLLMHSIGDGPSIINSAQIDQSVKDTFNKKYGLDQPIYIQLLLFWKNLFTGNLGVSLSIHLGSEINSFIWPKFGRSLLIGGIAAVVGMIVGVIFGVIIGLRPHKFFDKFMQIMIALFVALPAFIIALALVIVASKSHFPISYDDSNPITWILPIVSISIPLSMITTKFMRTRLLAALETPYTKLALTKGLTRRRIIIRHLLKESLFTIATNLPSSILLSVVSSILVENIFTIPGLGRLYTQAIQSKDYNVVLSITSMMVILVSLSFIIRDWLYVILNPRLRRSYG